MNNTSTYGNHDNNEKQGTGTYTQQSVQVGYVSKAHQIGVDTQITLKDRVYKVLSIISEDTAEAVIYKIEDQSSDIGVLKLYHEFPYNRKKEEPSHETLKRISNIDYPRILKLRDFGVENNEKYQQRYCFEISDFAAGGDLLNVSDFRSKYTPQFLEKVIVPQLYAAIKVFHHYKIYHCDIKPSNILYKNEQQTEIVLGDYGSAKAYDLDAEKDVNKTSTVKGTQFYIAPEQPHGLVSVKNDYYSLGKVLLHLLYSNVICENENFSTISKSASDRIVENAYKGLPLINYNPAYGRINLLIEGLTLNNPDSRWGDEQVAMWLRGENLTVNYVQQPSPSSTISIQLSGSKKVLSVEELSRFIETNDNWYQEIIEDDTTLREFLTLVNQTRGKDIRVALDKVINYCKDLESRISQSDRSMPRNTFTKESILWILAKSRNVTTYAGSLNFPVDGDLEQLFTDFLKSFDSTWKTLNHTDGIILPLFHLQMCLLKISYESVNVLDRQKAEILHDQLKSWMGMTASAQSPEIMYFPSLVYHFINGKDRYIISLCLVKMAYAAFENRTFRGMHDEHCNTLHEMALYFADNPDDYDKPEMKAEKELFLAKTKQNDYLNLSQKELLFKVFSSETESKIEIDNVQFDKNGNYTIRYKYFKSLERFFKSKGIPNGSFTLGSDVAVTYETKRSFFSPFSTIAHKFISDVSEKHGIHQLPADIKTQLSYVIIEESKNIFRKLYGGQIIAFIILIPLAYAVYLQTVNALNYQNIHDTSYSEEVVTEQIGIGYAYVTTSAANMRSNASKNASIILELPRNTRVELISRGYYDNRGTEWMYVLYGNQYGYMSQSVLNVFNY